ncbi:hypothetical protein ACOMHN_025872 [Nucella lapillus]
MSWAADEWKDGLPPQALQKIMQLEAQLDKFKKDRDQKQCQLESLEVALQNQKKKTEEEKASCAQLVRDNKSLSETCEDKQRKMGRLQHDIQSREGHIFSLEGQLARSRQVEGDSGKVTALTGTGTPRGGQTLYHTANMHGDTGKTQGHVHQMRGQVEQLEEDVKRLNKENKELTQKLATVNTDSQTLREIHTNTTTSSHSVKIGDQAKWSGPMGGWKEEGGPQVLKQMEVLEQQVDRLRKDKDQKQCQMDSLEQALQNQKRRTEEAKSETSSLQRELTALSETCQGLEQHRSKLLSEVTVKDNQNAFLTGQLNNTKASLDKEVNKVSPRQGSPQGQSSAGKSARSVLRREVRKVSPPQGSQQGSECSCYRQRVLLLLQCQSEQQRLQGEVTRLEGEVASLGLTKRELLEKKAATDLTLQTHSTTVESLRQQLNDADAHREKLGRQLEEVQGSLDTLREEKVKMEGRGQEEREDNQKLRALMMDKDLQLETALADRERLGGQLTDTSTQAFTLSQEVDRLQSELANSGHQWESRERAVRAEQEQRLSHLQEQLAHKEDTLAALTQDSHNLQQELDKVRHCYTEQSHTLDRVKQSKQAVEEERAGVEANCRRLEDDLDTARQQALDTQTAHSTALTNLQSSLRQLQGDYEELKQKYEDGSEVQKGLMSQLQELQERQEVVVEEKAGLQERVASLTLNLTNARDKCRFLQTFCLFSVAFILFLFICDRLDILF